MPIAREVRSFLSFTVICIVSCGEAGCTATSPASEPAVSQSSRVGGAGACAYYGGNGPSVYGGQSGLTESYASMVDGARLGALRLNFRLDGQSSWNDALLGQYDAYVGVAREHGYDVLGLVANEAVPGDQTAWNGDYDATGYSPYVQQFVDVVGMLMRRYGGTIKNWELWNEPNAWSNPSYADDPAHAGGTYILPQVYAKMLAETSLQNADTMGAQGLHLVTGGLFAHDIGGSFSPATDYFEQVLSQGVWDWMQANTGRRYPWDGAGYHLYIDQSGSTSSDHLMQYVDAIQSLKVQYGDYTPLWITEFGWQTWNVPEDVQAANIDVALQTFESRGDVARTFVFKVDDYDSWGIFHDYGGPKPAISVFQTHTATCASQ
ncbi:MAG TPA: glycosyl hydrolase [Polyangiaceae bacterium]